MTTEGNNQNLMPINGGKTGMQPSYAVPGWLLAWQPRDAMPMGRAEFDREKGCILAVRETAPPEAVAVALERLTSWLEAFGLMADDEHVPLVIDGYRKALERVPADLIGMAVEGVTTGLKYHRRPLPNDILAAVQPEIDRRNLAALKLELVGIVYGWPKEGLRP